MVELGLNPALIERAALEVAQTPEVSFWTRLLGGPWDAKSDEVIEGHVTEADWPSLLVRIRDITGRVGYPSANTGAFEWLTKEPDVIHISIVPTGNQTRVRVVGRFGMWAGVFLVLPFVLSFFPLIAAAVFTKTGHPLEAVLLALMPLLIFAVGRIGFGKLCIRKRRQFETLAREIDTWITENSRQTQQTPFQNLVEGYSVPDNTEPAQLRSKS